MKRDQIIYRVATYLLALLYIAGPMMYFFNYDVVSATFVNLGFPTWLIYPLAVVKLLGVLAILTNAVPFLKELAYAGIFYNALLAFVAHLVAADGEWAGALMALVLLSVSWYFDRRLKIAAA